METLPGDETGGVGVEDEHLWYCLVLDEDGNPLAEGAEVELVDSELECVSGVPVFYGQEWRNVERPAKRKRIVR
jgi:hypothetical protein